MKGLWGAGVLPERKLGSADGTQCLGELSPCQDGAQVSTCQGSRSLKTRPQAAQGPSRAYPLGQIWVFAASKAAGVGLERSKLRWISLPFLYSVSLSLLSVMFRVWRGPHPVDTLRPHHTQHVPRRQNSDQCYKKVPIDRWLRSPSCPPSKSRIFPQPEVLIPCRSPCLCPVSTGTSVQQHSR